MFARAACLSTLHSRQFQSDVRRRVTHPTLPAFEMMDAAWPSQDRTDIGTSVTNYPHSNIRTRSTRNSAATITTGSIRGRASPMNTYMLVTYGQ